MTLRAHQIDLRTGVYRAIANGHDAVLAQAPTGFGKTHMVVEGIIAPSIAQGRRFVFAAHLEELIDDTAGRHRAMGLPCGVVKSGRAADPAAPVQVASTPTLAAMLARGEALPLCDRLIIDEAHRASSRTLREIIGFYRARGTKILGLTATPARGDGLPLDEFDRIVCGPQPGELVRLGALVPCEVIAPLDVLERGVALVQGAMPEALGQIYVERHFPPANKQRMVELVDNLLRAFGAAIDELDWMSADTKAEARAKLATFRAKIGYPDVWRDYSALTADPTDLVGNVRRSSVFEHDYEIGKLGGPVDRDEWLMPPQMVNAYYNPEMNEIVFPAAILQPPFFTMAADDAVNYGGIGAVIGHEISHGFDDKGSQYDGEGNLRNWWTEADHAAFSERTAALEAQYAGYEPVAGHPINGELTLGENIADLSGLAVALRAYRASLAGAEAPVIDGLTGEQRFFAGWAQVWRAKTRSEEAIRRVATDPHSPPEYRVLGVLVNSDDFVAAFDVQPGDGMWRDPSARVRIW